MHCLVGLCFLLIIWASPASSIPCPYNCVDSDHGECNDATGECSCKPSWTGNHCRWRTLNPFSVSLIIIAIFPLNDTVAHGVVSKGSWVYYAISLTSSVSSLQV